MTIKPNARPKPSRPSHPKPAAPQAPARYTLAAVIAEGASFDGPLRDLLFRRVGEASLLARGTRIDTAHITDAMPDFFGSVRAIWAGLNARQRALVVGYSPDYDGILAQEVAVLEDMRSKLSHFTHHSATTRTTSRTAHRKARSVGVALRTQAVNGLRPFLGDEDELALVLEKGTAETFQDLEAGLLRVAQRVESHRTEDADVAAALDRTGVTEEFVARLRQVAAEVRTTGELAEATADETRVTQRQLDIQDGRVLHLVGIIHRAFRVAGDQDETILAPRLGAMAVLFDGRVRSGGAPEGQADSKGPALLPKPQPASATTKSTKNPPKETKDKAEAAKDATETAKDVAPPAREPAPPTRDATAQAGGGGAGEGVAGASAEAGEGKRDAA